MLRVNTKKNITGILESIVLLCEKCFQQDDIKVLYALQDAQGALITVGECLEKELDDATEIISHMESVCEFLYLLSQDLDKKTEYRDKIIRLLKQIISKISEVEVCYQVVFFPYKADMWDSLESIWLACREDRRCDCKVVPIPYSHFDANKNEWIYCYEIDKFPSYVPVIHYEEYDLQEKADAAFVHNPYDEYNYVTHIRSDYYSYNLKKFVKKLFYVPYFVTSGPISKKQQLVSVNSNADYLMVQSEVFKEGLREYEYYDKAVVVGSPKLDRVIRLSNEKTTIPEKWKTVLAGKKSLMLNTSLNQFLYDSEAYLNKLLYLFRTIQKRNDVVLIWRPHPLLRVTIESIRPYLLEQYLELQRFFIEEKIGILDTTPDIINTIVTVDGYIGEVASSVVNLFEAVGKPLYIINNYICDDFSVEEKRCMLIRDCEKIGDTYYCVSMENSNIYEVKASDWEQMRSKTAMENVPKWLPASTSGVSINEFIYFAPVWSQEFFSYDVKNNILKTLSCMRGNDILNYRAAMGYKNKVFYLPTAKVGIMEYDISTETWKEYIEPIQALQMGISEMIYESIWSYFVTQNKIWMTNLYSNRILQFDMETGKYQIYEIGENSARYAAIAVVKDKLYLSDAYSGNIDVWNLPLLRKINTYTMPKDWHVVKNMHGRTLAQDKLLLIGNHMLVITRFANGLVEIDLQTGKALFIAKEFWSDVLVPTNNYKPEVHGIITFAKIIDNHTLLVQKRRDGSLLELNINTREYNVHYPKLAVGELDKLLCGEDGFEKSHINGEYVRRESRYFTLEGFLDDLVNDRLGDVMIRQKSEMETMAINLDGTCGEKVYEFMMNVLKKDGTN